MDRPGLLSRRNALKSAGALALAVSALEMAGPLAWAPQRADAATALPDIQFDIAALLTTPPQTSDTGVVSRCHPCTPCSSPGGCSGPRPSPTRRCWPMRSPDRNQLRLQRHQHPDLRVLRDPLLQQAARGADRQPRVRAPAAAATRHGRYVLEEAVPGPTDVGPANPGITKLRYNVPVADRVQRPAADAAQRQPVVHLRRAGLAGRQ